MAGTVTETRTRASGEYRNDMFPLVTRIELAWTSDSSGNATYTTAGVNGTILRFVTDPGSTAPTDNYDVTLSDENGVDVLSGLGANRDASNTEESLPYITVTDGTNSALYPRSVAGPLSLSISNAGSAKQGSLILYVR